MKIRTDTILGWIENSLLSRSVRSDNGRPLHEARMSAKGRLFQLVYLSRPAAFMNRPGGWPVWRLKAVLKVLAEP